jgi:pimeloyl-ACP methyl ester carboxylesterase
VIATTDLGGDGPALVLSHGLGNSRGQLVTLTEAMTGFRIITMDLRGHGESTTEPFTWEGAVDDLRTVVERYELENPYLAGHSLGGMVALQYALAGRPTAGVINIDGWGPGYAPRFLGEDPALVQKRLDEIGAGHLPSRLARLSAARTRQGREGTTRQVLGLLHDADVVGWHRDAPCRSLAFNAVAPGSRLLGKEMQRLQAAHRQGLRRDLAALPEKVTVVEVDAGHFLHNSHSALVAQRIREFADA